VARIARDDGSSSANRSSDGYDKLIAVMQLRGMHFSVTHFIPSLRTSVTQILLPVLYVGSRLYVRCGAILGRCGN